jgi:hypothetical protein
MKVDLDMAAFDAPQGPVLKAGPRWNKRVGQPTGLAMKRRSTLIPWLRGELAPPA